VIPAAAKQIAFNLPPSTERLIGQHALETLDHSVLEPSRLSLERQSQLRELFSSMLLTLDGAGTYQIAFRSSKQLGANALALPSGTIVITDGLVNLAANDHEIKAVLAHEIGHLQERHGLRQLLQSSATALLAIGLVGDVSTGSSFLAALPTLLLQSKYSKEFEKQADAFAFAYLKRAGIPAEALLSLLQRIERQSDKAGTLPDYLSSHPGIQERVENAKTAK
jgi:predicted Zn-dependent protease